MNFYSGEQVGTTAPVGQGDRKDISGKLEFHYLSWPVLEEVGKVFATSKQVHGNCDSWKESGPDSIWVYWNALFRHMFKFAVGSDLYEEERTTFDGKKVIVTWRHSAQIIWNAHAICYKSMQKEGKL
jgi:hypothetical protein